MLPIECAFSSVGRTNDFQSLGREFKPLKALYTF